MKRFLVILAIILGVSVGLTMPVMAEPEAGDASSTSETSDGGKCVSTSILGEGGQYCDDGSGSGIVMVLGIVVNVLTFGIGVAATVGLVLAGIQYLTAGDNAGQVQKAKARIFHIVIGLAIYAMFWGALQFLLPGGLFGDGS